MTDDTVSGAQLREAIDLLNAGRAKLMADHAEIRKRDAELETVVDLLTRTSHYVGQHEPVPPPLMARLLRFFRDGSLAEDRLEFLAVRAETGDDWAAEILDLIEHDEA